MRQASGVSAPRSSSGATGYTVLVQLDNRESNTLPTGLARVMHSLPSQARRTLTWAEWSSHRHKRVCDATGM